MNELQVSDFSDWNTAFTAGQMVGGGSMTRSASRISEAMGTISSMMSELSSASSSSLAARTVGGELSDSGADFDDLLSGNGTDGDAIDIVHAVSGAVADTVKVCGPSPYTQYAPAQEQALDDLIWLDPGSYSGTYSNSLSVLSGGIQDDRTFLTQEENFDALGPNGEGGDCTVSTQMDNAAENVGAGISGFSEETGYIAGNISRNLGHIKELRTDISTIESEGLTPPAGAAQAIGQDEETDSQATASVNSDIDTENSLVEQAYSMADAMATNESTLASEHDVLSCGSGPEQPVLLQQIG